MSWLTEKSASLQQRNAARSLAKLIAVSNELDERHVAGKELTVEGAAAFRRARTSFYLDLLGPVRPEQIKVDLIDPAIAAGGVGESARAGIWFAYEDAISAAQPSPTLQTASAQPMSSGVGKPEAASVTTTPHSQGLRYLTLAHPATGQRKSIKVGWSWTCFLLCGFFGIPLFMRGLTNWGMAIIALMLVNYVATAAEAPVLSLSGWAAGTWLSVYFGIHANAMTVRTLMQNGWTVVEQDLEAVAA